MPLDQLMDNCLALRLFCMPPAAPATIMAVAALRSFFERFANPLPQLEL